MKINKGIYTKVWNTDVDNGQGFLTTSLSWKHEPRACDPWVRDTQEPLRKSSFGRTTYDNVGDQFNHLNRFGGYCDMGISLGTANCSVLLHLMEDLSA